MNQLNKYSYFWDGHNTLRMNLGFNKYFLLYTNYIKCTLYLLFTHIRVCTKEQILNVAIYWHTYCCTIAVQFIYFVT